MSEFERSPEQAARERALSEVHDTLEEIEHAARRAERARRAVGMLAGCDDLAKILTTAATRLENARKDLMQGAYFNAGQSRLF